MMTVKINKEFVGSGYADLVEMLLIQISNIQITNGTFTLENNKATLFFSRK